MNSSLETYRKKRDDLLTRIVQALSKDERFVAAWLGGSFGRHEEDAISDLDLSVVVAASYCETLCSHPEQFSAKTTKERLDLFSQFGQPLVIHENNHNAPEGGTFTFILYNPSALMVDWILIPLAIARRPDQSLLLFDKGNIPVNPTAEPEQIEQRITKVEERIAFFWMMAAVTAKYIVRNDAVFVTCWLEELHKIINEVKRLITGEAWQYQRGSLSVQETSREDQISALYRLCEQMSGLMPKVIKSGGHVQESPMPAIETLLSLVPHK